MALVELYAGQRVIQQEVQSLLENLSKLDVKKNRENHRTEEVGSRGFMCG